MSTQIRDRISVDSVSRTLNRFPPAYNAAILGFRGVAKVRQRGQIRQYIDTHEKRYMRIGSGSVVRPGWLSVDLHSIYKGVVYMDATKPFPIEDNTFDGILTEHMIEHITHDQGRFMLGECFRVLRDGGAIRVGTPPLDLVKWAFTKPDDATMQRYIRWSNTWAGTPTEQAEPDSVCFFTNRVLGKWGHQFIYDEPTLRAALAEAGFSNITRVNADTSNYFDEADGQTHAEIVGEEWNTFETMVLEAVADKSK